MHRHAIISQKGGVCKTTSAVNLAAILSVRFGKRVLLIDLCPQGHSSRHLGLRPDEPTSESAVYEVLVRGKPLLSYVQKTPWNLDVLPGGYDVEAAASTLSGKAGAEYVFREIFEEEVPSDAYDVVLYDCPPSLSVLSRAALIGSTGYIVPMPMQYMALDGYDLLLKTIGRIRKHQNPGLGFVGLIGCNTKKESRHGELIRQEVAETVGGAKFEREVRYSEYAGPAFNEAKPLIDYAPGSVATLDYCAVAAEMIERGAV